MSSIQEIPSWCFGDFAFFLNIKRSCEAKRYENKENNKESGLQSTAT